MQFERHVVFWVAALAVFAGLLWLLSPILLPFVLGMVVAYLLDPLANRLVKRGFNRIIAALVIVGGFVAAFVILLLLVAPLLIRQLAGFIEHVPGYVMRLQHLITDADQPWLKSILGDSLGSDDPVSELLNQAMKYVTVFLGSLWRKGETVLSLFSLLIITPVVAFYLICDWDRTVATVDRLIPLRQRETVHGLAREMDTAISAYMRGQSGVCLILGCYYATGLTLAGLSFGLLIGVACGIISFIPYVGSVTALLVSLGVAVAQFFPDWTRIIIVAGVVLVGQFLEGNFLSPKLVGGSIGVHPVWLMFALFAFAYLFGFVGLLLAVPLAAASAVLMRFALRRYLASPLYTGSQLG